MATTSKKSSSRSSSGGNRSSHSGGSQTRSHSSSRGGNSGGNNTGTILALAAGAVAGAGLALLLAPQTGSDTRRALKRTAQNLKDDLSNTLQQGFDKINGLVGGNSGNTDGYDNEGSSSYGVETGRMQSTTITGTIGTPGPSNTGFDSGL
jgi:gas vesicle protein